MVSAMVSVVTIFGALGAWIPALVGMAFIALGVALIFYRKHRLVCDHCGAAVDAF